MNGHFFRNTCRWPKDTWKDAQHQSSSGKYESKLQWDTISYLSEWLKLATQETTDVGKDAEKGEPSYTVGGNAIWYSHSGKQYGGSLKKKKIELPYNPAIAVLGTYLKNTKILIQRDTHTLMFIAVLSTIAKLWKQPKCPSTDEWNKKTWCSAWVAQSVKHLTSAQVMISWFVSLSPA